MDRLSSLEQYQVHPPYLGGYFICNQVQSLDFEAFPNLGL